MIDRLVFLTRRIKEMLIGIGCELPPAATMSNNKIKQIDLDFKQLARVLTGNYTHTLYANASLVFTYIMTEQYKIDTLNDLLCVSERVFAYIYNY